MTLQALRSSRTQHTALRDLHVRGCMYSSAEVGYVVVVYLYLTSAKCTGIAAFSLWPEATALT